MLTRKLRRCAIGLGGLLAAAGLPLSVSAQVHLRTIGVAGEPAPDAAAGVIYTTFQFAAPVINDRGDVVMVPVTSGSDGTGSFQAIVVSPAAGFTRILARVTDAAASQAAGVVYSRLYLPALNNDGEVALQAQITGGVFPAAGADALYFVPADGTPHQLLLTTGDAVPGIDGATFGSLLGATSSPDFSLSGRVLQAITITGGATVPADRTLLVRLTPGSPVGYEQLARRGTQTPVLPAGVLYSSFGQFSMADDGAAIFLSNATGTGITSANDGCIWYYPPAGAMPLLLVREGNGAPGLSGPLFGSGSWARISGRGDIAVLLGLTGSGVGSANDKYLAVFPPIEAGQAVPPARVVARESAQPIPGYPPAAFVNVLDVTSQLQVNANGQTAYALNALNMVTAEDSGVISEARGIGTPQLVAREGLQAPGCPAGVVFDELMTGAAARFAISDVGHAAFFAPVRGTGVSTANDYGLWLVDPEGEVNLLAREGQTIDITVNGTVVSRTIATLLLQGDAFPKTSRRWLNNSGEVVFPVTFTDTSSAVLVASLPPECRADFNGMGGVTLQDLFDYLGAWFANDNAADFNGVGGVTLQDLFDFLGAWFVGCP